MKSLQERIWDADVRIENLEYESEQLKISRNYHNQQLIMIENRQESVREHLVDMKGIRDMLEKRSSRQQT